MCAKETNWYLRKPDGSEYGPVTTSELLRWATQSRIVAGNGVSSDRETWQKVEDIPELEMNWMAQRPDGREYGPFNIAATRELFEHDVLPADAMLTNRTTRQSVTVDQVLNEEDLFVEDTEPESPPEEPEPEEAPAKKPGKRNASRVEKTEEEPVEEPEEQPEDAPEDSADETPEEEEEEEEEEPESTEEVPEETDPELEALNAQVEKLQAKLDKARSDLRQNRKERTAEKTEAESAATALTAERDEAQKELAQLQQEIEALREKHAEDSAAREAELATAHATVDEANGARKQAEAKLARLDNERSEAEEQAIQSTAELRKQTAFMKKNIATLQSELEAMRVKAGARGKALAIILTLLFLAGGAFLLIGLPSCRDEEPAINARKAAAKDRPGKAPPAKASPSPSTDRKTGSPPTTPPTPTPRASTPSPLTPWPKIMVEGVKVRPEAHVCTMQFDSGVFASLTTPSAAAINQLKSIANTIRPQMSHFQLIVEGHTDDKPLKSTASFDGNYALGLARAEAIRKLLITSGKLPGNSIRAVSAGEGKAPYPNDSAANRKRNRTVVLKLVRKQR